MKFFCTAGALTLAIALVPAFKAWPTTPSEETPAGDEEFELLGRIEFPCGSEIEEWIVNVGVGNPPQYFPMVIDTATNISYVSGKECTTDFCLQDKRFDSSLSTTLEDLDTYAQLIYEDTEESVEGNLYRDEFHFGDLIFEGIEFIDIYNTSNLEPLGYTGSFAIGFPEDELPDDFKDDYYNNESKYKKRAKGASLTGGSPPSIKGGSSRRGKRKRDNVEGDEEAYCSLDFGVDYESINGEIAWFDLPKSNFGDSPLWKTQLNGVKSGSNLDLTFTDTLASFDSSVSGIEVSAPDLDKVHEALGATCSEEGSTEYLFECSKASDLVFSFEKYDVTIPFDAWIIRKEDNSGLCNTTIVKTESDDAPTNRWHLGRDFLSEFYSIYSVKREQTGLALVVDGSEGALIHAKSAQ